MMELKGAFVELGGKVWLRRGLRLFIRCGSISNQKINNNHNAAAAEESGMLLQKGGGVVSCSWADQEEGERGRGGGVVRMKIVVRKSDLKHLVSTASTGVKAAATAQQRPTTRTTTMSCVNVKVPYPYSTAEQRLNNLIMYNACIIIFIIHHPPHVIIIFRAFHHSITRTTSSSPSDSPNRHGTTVSSNGNRSLGYVPSLSVQDESFIGAAATPSRHRSLLRSSATPPPTATASRSATDYLRLAVTNTFTPSALAIGFVISTRFRRS